MSAEPTGVPAPTTTRSPDRDAMARAVAEFLRAAGLPEAGAGEAPGLCAAAWCESLLVGYEVDPVEILRPTWADEAGELVAVRRIPFVSVCAHHLLPFFGHADVCYVPAGEITGLSRIEDLVHCLSRRLQMQERLGREITAALAEATGARGAACVLRAQHLCVFARGQRRQGTITETVALLGDLDEDRDLRERFARWLGTAPAAEARS